MKEKLAFIIIFFFAVFLVCGQTPERSEKEESLLSDVVSVLDKATGWMLQNNGEWVSEKNKIPFKDYKLNKTNRGKYGLGMENFEEIVVRQAVVESTVYSVLIIKYTDGKYEFPVLEQNWEEFDALKYYVFNEAHWNLVFPDSIIFNKPYAVNLNLLCSGTIDSYNEKTYLFEIENNIQKAVYLNEKSLTNLIFAVYPVNLDGKKFIRFKFYETINKREIYVKYLLRHNWHKLFRNYYYEVKFDDFREFVENIGVINPSLAGSSGYYNYFFKSGIKSFNDGEYNTALVNFTKAFMVKTPDSVRASIHLWKGKSLIMLKNFKEALPQFDSAIILQSLPYKTRNIPAKARYMKGIAYRNMHDYLMACENWQQAYDAGYAQALDMIKKHCGKSMHDADAALDFERADKLFDKGLRLYNNQKYLDALLAFEASAQNNPVSSDLRIPYYMGMSRFNLSDYSRAIDDFARAIQMAGQNGAEQDELLINSYLMRGKAWQKIGNTAKACSDWQEADNLGSVESASLLNQYCEQKSDELPQTDEASLSNLFSLAVDAYETGEYREAVNLFNQITDVEEDFPNLLLYTYRASAKHKLQDYRGAVEDFTKAIEMEPKTQDNYQEWVRAHFNRGVSQYFLDDRSGACSDWRRAVELGMQESTAREYIRKYCNN